MRLRQIAMKRFGPEGVSVGHAEEAERADEHMQIHGVDVAAEYTFPAASSQDFSVDRRELMERLSSPISDDRFVWLA